MKRILIVLLLSAITPFSHADEVGGWVRVDANGIPVGGVEVCAQSVCGDPDSEFSKAVLGAGERYVKQTNATPDGNVAGYAPQEGVSVRVDLETNDWIIEQRGQRIIPNTTLTTNTTLVINPNKTETQSSLTVTVPENAEIVVNEIEPFVVDEYGVQQPNPEFWQQWFYLETGLIFTLIIN